MKLSGKVKLLLDFSSLTVYTLIRVLTQSIGLLSYTFLTQTQLDRILVPMVSGISHFLLLKGYGLNATSLLDADFIQKIIKLLPYWLFWRL